MWASRQRSYVWRAIAACKDCSCHEAAQEAGSIICGVAKCPHLEVEEGCGGDEQYPFSLLLSCRPVQVLEHIQRQGICTRKSKSGTFGPNQELNQVAGSELLLASLPILGSCSAKGFGQSHVASAVPTSLLFVIMQSLNKLWDTLADVLTGPLVLCHFAWQPACLNIKS